MPSKQRKEEEFRPEISSYKDGAGFHFIQRGEKRWWRFIQIKMANVAISQSPCQLTLKLILFISAPSPDSLLRAIRAKFDENDQ